MWSFPAPYASLLCCMLLLCISTSSGGDTKTLLKYAKECFDYVPSCENFQAAVQGHRVVLGSAHGSITTHLLDLPYTQQCYVHVKSSMTYQDAHRVCLDSIGLVPIFTKHDKAEAAAVWKATGTNDGLWTGVFFRGSEHEAYCRKTMSAFQFFDEDDDFEWAEGEPSINLYDANTYINGSTPAKLYDVGGGKYEFVCMAILNRSTTTPTESSTAPLAPTLQSPLGQNSTNSDSTNSDSADLTGVWVTIGLLMTIFLLATVFIVYKKVRARQDMKSQATEKTARSMENKRSDAQPRMQRNDMGRLHTHDTLSMTSEVQSEGTPAVLGLHSTTASASGVHIGNIVDVHQISRVDPNRGKCDETADGQSAISGNTFPFQP